MIKITTTITLALLLIWSNSFGAPQTYEVWVVPHDFSYHNLKEQLYITPISSENHEDLNQLNWQLYNFGNIRDDIENYLARIEIHNPHDITTNIKISTFFFDYVSVYGISQQGDTIHESHNNGYLVPIHNRQDDYFQTSIIPISLPPGSISKWHFHIKNLTVGGKGHMRQSFKMGFMAYSKRGFKKWYEGGERFHFFLFGICLLLGFFNLSIFLWGKDRTYLFLAIYNFAFSNWMLLYGGLLIYFNLVVDYDLERTLRQTLVTIPLSSSYSLFAYHFLNFKKIAPKLGVFLLCATSLLFAMIILYMLKLSEYALVINEFLSIIIYLTIFIGSIISFRQNQQFSGFFLVGSLIVNVGLIGLLWAYNNDEINYLFGSYFALCCLTIDALLFTTITSGKFITNQKERVQLQIEKSFLKNQLDQKNRQLTTFLTEQMNKNKILETLQEKLKESGAAKTTVTKLEKVVNQLKNEHANWETFKMYFDNVHPEFLEQLSSKYQNLTTNDLRISAFLKMGLKTKEIATVNGITPRAVEKARERLKKKMNVDDLMRSIMEIDPSHT